MGNAKIIGTAFFMVKEISESSGVKITSETSYADFFSSCVEDMKLSIEKAHIRMVFKLINFLESETEPLKEWEKDMLAVLYRRKSVSLCG